MSCREAESGYPMDANNASAVRCHEQTLRAALEAAFARYKSQIKSGLRCNDGIHVRICHDFRLDLLKASLKIECPLMRLP